MFFITWVAATLGIPGTVAATVVNEVLGAGTLVTVLGIIASVASSDATALMTMGWLLSKRQ